MIYTVKSKFLPESIKKLFELRKSEVKKQKDSEGRKRAMTCTNGVDPGNVAVI